MTDLLPRVREVLEAVRQGHALLHALRTALVKALLDLPWISPGSPLDLP